MLELQNISYLVDDDNKEILRDINLAFDEKFVAITGPNGSGKSTLAKIIAGILKPTSGKILLDGEDITDLSITDTFRNPMNHDTAIFGGISTNIWTWSGQTSASIMFTPFHLHNSLNIFPISTFFSP